MNTKAFLVLIMIVIVLGGSIGGAFAGGVALGKSQDDDETTAATTVPGGFQAPSAGSGRGDTAGPGGNFTPGGFSGGFNGEDRAALRNWIQSGDISPEELAERQSRFQGGGFDGQSQDHDSQQFQGGFGRDAGGFGGSGLFGTVASIDGGTLTVETIDGPQEVAVGDDTEVRLFVDGTLEDLWSRSGVERAVGPPNGGPGAPVLDDVLARIMGKTGSVSGTEPVGDRAEVGSGPRLYVENDR